MTNSHAVFRNLIFDLDGTLTDPRESFANCIGFALSRLGKSAPPSEQLYQYIGPPIHGTFTSLLETTDADLIEQAVGFYRQRIGAEGIGENVAYSGVVDALIDLRAAGCQLFVATA
ncbi:MAG: Haloacid dehalogenase domain protein hydrolase [Capsulimonas sp.]|jgi:phosphoglycolate phosphatase|nr:Haloacid dehalogenase domain protein hydrolase [Capsulimonas sp.]